MTNITEHRDDEASKMGMWIFIFSELFFFLALFVVYAIYRHINLEAFKLASLELSIGIGTLNTIILLISSASIAMSISAIQKKDKKLSIILVIITIILAIIFLINKYFEWTGKISHGIYPGSEILHSASQGEILFFGLYYAMTGLHALHIIIGIILMSIVCKNISDNKIDNTNYVLLLNCGLYWHLVDLIWIFLFPLFYLIN